MRRRIAIGASVTAAFACGIGIGAHATVRAQAPVHVYEIRTYTAGEGKLPLVLKRFKEHELQAFEKNGMHAILYSVAAEPPLSENTFVYILEHKSRDAAKESWKGFMADPEVRKAIADSNEGGRAVVKVESVFVTPTDFSPLK